jgi:uncharacterized membrane protein
VGYQQQMTQSTNFQENETVRIEAFSDGVFAIAITLLTLELKAPDLHNDFTGSTLFHELLLRWPSYLAFFLSFATIFIIWVNHHRMYSVIQRADARFIYLNGGLLLLVSVIPFTTSVLAKYVQTSATQVSAALYMLLLAGVAFAFWLMWNYATRDYLLLKRPAADVLIEPVKTRFLIAIGVYSASAALAFVLPYLSIAVGLAMVVYLAELKYHRQKTV